MNLPEPIQDRRKGERRRGERRASNMELLFELQRQTNDLYNLTFEHLQRSALGAEQCSQCGAFYLRPMIHICASDDGDEG